MNGYLPENKPPSETSDYFKLNSSGQRTFWPIKKRMKGNKKDAEDLKGSDFKFSFSSDYDNSELPVQSLESKSLIGSCKHLESTEHRSSRETAFLSSPENVCDFTRIEEGSSLNLKQRRQNSTLSAMIGGNKLGSIEGGKDRAKVRRHKRWQQEAYNFLERPTGIKSYVYHVIVFFFVLVCLIISVLSTIDDQYEHFQALATMEIILVAIFSIEYLVRMWSVGCVSKYGGWRGRLQFAKQPICLIDLGVVCGSVIILVGWEGNVFAASAVRGIRFLQIIRMLHVDRQGGTWRLLGSVVYIHRQELITTLYIGFLALIFSSYFVYVAEQPAKGTPEFQNYAEALWWGVVTVTTIGYGDFVPKTWLGKVIASCFSIFAISFFALPAGILGSGFALKVQQNQRQKQFNRQIPAAARIIQASWRLFATSEGTRCVATWKVYNLPKFSNPQPPQFDRHNNKESKPDVSRAFASAAKRFSLAPRRNTKSTLPKEKSFPDSVTTSSTVADLSKASQKPQDCMPGPYKNTVRAARKLIYFLTKKRFQAMRRPYDVRDVVEQYSQGHANITMKMKELQRRLDQTLGKPTSFHENENQSCLSHDHRQRYTVGGRLQRLESLTQANSRRLEEIAQALHRIEEKLSS